MNIKHRATDTGGEATEAKLYKTADLGLISTLSLSYPIKSIDRSDSRKVLFVFEQTVELASTVEQYWSGKLLVEPQRFTNQTKCVKTRIYSGE